MCVYIYINTYMRYIIIIIFIAIAMKTNGKMEIIHSSEPLQTPPSFATPRTSRQASNRMKERSRLTRTRMPSRTEQRPESANKRNQMTSRVVSRADHRQHAATINTNNTSGVERNNNSYEKSTTNLHNNNNNNNNNNNIDDKNNIINNDNNSINRNRDASFNRLPHNYRYKDYGQLAPQREEHGQVNQYISEYSYESDVEM